MISKWIANDGRLKNIRTRAAHILKQTVTKADIKMHGNDQLHTAKSSVLVLNI